MSNDRLIKPSGAILAVLLVAACANYYMDLGWFGRYGRAVVNVLILSVIVLVVNSRAAAQKT